MARQTNDGSLDESDFKKITSYYGLAVPAILGEALCVLRGNKMSERERKALTYQGAMTGLFDDFFDKENVSDEAVKAFLEKPEEVNIQNARQKLFIQFYKKAFQYVPDPQSTLTYLKKVYDAQVESKKQAIPGSLSKEEIKRITVDKGGVSVLFYRTALTGSLTDTEESSLYKMGGLMQFGNDIFDVYKDCQNKIDTLMTTAKKVNDVRSDFTEMIKESFNSLFITSYKKKNIEKFHLLIYMSLCSRCFVCLDQLERKEKQTNNVFLPYQYTRKELICDMEKTSNKWRTIRQFAAGS